jgi:hypothetical protein
MKYDFKKVREVMNERSLTLADLERLTAEVGRRVHYTTIAKALLRGSAHQTTAKALAAAIRVPVKTFAVKDEAA